MFYYLVYGVSRILFPDKIGTTIISLTAILLPRFKRANFSNSDVRSGRAALSPDRVCRIPISLSGEYGSIHGKFFAIREYTHTRFTFHPDKVGIISSLWHFPVPISHDSEGGRYPLPFFPTSRGSSDFPHPDKVGKRSFAINKTLREYSIPAYLSRALFFANIPKTATFSIS